MCPTGNLCPEREPKEVMHPALTRNINQQLSRAVHPDDGFIFVTRASFAFSAVRKSAQVLKTSNVQGFPCFR